MIFHYILCFFGQNTSVPRVNVKPVTRDKLQKYIRIPNGAESGLLHDHCLLTKHVFRAAATEM